MKKFVLLIFISLLAFSSCSMKQQAAEYQKATIKGPDLSMCACCGGWFIEIGKKTYRFYILPDDSNLDLKTAEFPLKVEVVWRKDKEGCKGDEIIIEKIKER